MLVSSGRWGLNRIVALTRTPLVAFHRFDHPEGVTHRDPEEEQAPSHAISFIEAGGYEFHLERRRWLVDDATVTAWRPGMVYRARHAASLPDDVLLSLEYSDRYAEDIATTAGKPLPRTPVLRLDNRLAYLRLLLQRLAEAPGDDLALETLAGDVFSAVATYAERPRCRNYGGRQLAWYAERMQAVRQLLDHRHDDRHSLTSLGGYVGMSPYHLAHVFRELVGTPPHRYLLHSRLRRAAERLRSGESVTDTCFAVGFSNLSHFIRLFRRRYGVTPSRFARD